MIKSRYFQDNIKDQHQRAKMEFNGLGLGGHFERDFCSKILKYRFGGTLGTLGTMQHLREKMTGCWAELLYYKHLGYYRCY